MATTTNFGWETPDDTDLVKDGAAAIRTLGGAIDTSLVDLKGGTTGQILSKASNTDMDFTWVTDSGDISGVTAGAGLSGGGTSGAVTLNLATTAAGRNAVINGGMNIWQRGTSISVAASAGITYTADRWCLNTGANQAMTISRQATGDTTNLPNIQYALRYQRNLGQTGTGGLFLSQSIESINAIPFTGQTVTLSFYARAGANYSATSSALSAIVYTGTGTDQNQLSGFTGSATPINSTATLTTTWQRFSYSGTISTSATEIATAFYFTPTGTAGAADYYEITGVQLELGSSATPFSRAGGTIQGELAACQRYYWNLTGSNSLPGIGYYQSATEVNVVVNNPVFMRTTPTCTVTTGTNYYGIKANGTDDTFNDLTLTTSFASQNATMLFTTTNVSGTSGSAGAVRFNNASAKIEFSAEL